MEWLEKPVSLSMEMQDPVPIEKCGDLVGIELTEGMKKCGYTSFFPVQLALLQNFQHHRDYGVMAPTGSGKTLAYIVPILKSLLNRRIVRLRALIIVPTRILVLQVYKVLSDLIAATTGCNLKIGSATGKTALSKEQNRLFDANEGRSKVDILIATPGRLVEHIRFTPGFSLKDLQFFIVDEADRLLEQAYQDWLQLVHESTCMEDRVVNPFGSPLEDIRWRKYNRLQKIVLSASLTKNSSQLMHLHLSNPTLIKISNFNSHVEPSLPSSLSHYYIVIPAGKKPISMLYILTHLNVKKSLCFTLSSQTAVRLAQFVKSAGRKCSFITNETDANIIDVILDSFPNLESELLIASDGLSRGLDLPGVDSVINYDCPTSSQLYLHRAGRCARAGKAGACYTIVTPSEARFYKENVCINAKRIRPDAESLQGLANIARDALDRK